MAYNLMDKTWKTLIEAGKNDLQSSFLRNDSLFFVSASSGTDNIYLTETRQESVDLSQDQDSVPAI